MGNIKIVKTCKPQTFQGNGKFPRCVSMSGMTRPAFRKQCYDEIYSSFAVSTWWASRSTGGFALPWMSEPLLWSLLFFWLLNNSFWNVHIVLKESCFYYKGAVTIKWKGLWTELKKELVHGLKNQKRFTKPCGSVWTSWKEVVCPPVKIRRYGHNESIKF